MYLAVEMVNEENWKVSSLDSPQKKYGIAHYL